MRLLPNVDLRRLAIRYPEDVPLARSQRLRYLRLSRHLRIELNHRRSHRRTRLLHRAAARCHSYHPGNHLNYIVNEEGLFLLQFGVRSKPSFLLPKSRNICWRCGERKEFLSMKRMTAGDLQALELLMQTTPGFEHFDSGADGILPECRSCRFHRPFWKYQSCVFAECPYCRNPVSTLKNQSGTSAAGKEINHG